MPSIHRTLFISALVGLSVVYAECGDNGGAVTIGMGHTSGNGPDSPQFCLGFNSSGPFDAAGNPILSVVTSDDPDALAAWLCGQANPDWYPQTTFGFIISEYLGGRDETWCLTVSELEAANATVSLLPCVSDIFANPVPSQTFEWIGTNYITYGFAFLGNQSGLPLSPSVATDYTPSLVAASNTTAAYLRLNYTPGGLPPSTGQETGLILLLSDD
ncbi:hypothetical protein C8R46DRAFT_1232950 [Mycena filopes]|nr:hypothetical protein C8R46DRAFT_1232950 [Mycena filopes]